jgi:hypothetical protein
MAAVLTGAALLAGEVAASGVACALEASQTNVVAVIKAVAQRAECGRVVRLMAGNSCPAVR